MEPGGGDGLMLTVAGITVRVANGGGARQLENVVVGDEDRAFNGSHRSTVRAQKRRYSIPSAWHTEAELATLRAACGPGVYVTVVVNGVTLTAQVTIQDAAYLGFGGTVLRTFTLAIEEQ